MRYSITSDHLERTLTITDVETLPVWGVVPFVIFLSWVGMSTSGHTKRITVNAVVLIAYCTGNAVGPFMWQARYKPRNHVPFAVIGACSATSALTLFFTRRYLAYQNKKRDDEAAARAGQEDKYDEVYITVMEDGNPVERKVDRVRSFVAPSPLPSLKFSII